ncbi:hypothetical protein GIB67_023154 [Kingdonia uniflora]|uniref:Uncharacterized protein n=1 Tax=Kingdonia uniflora TaxID=39325 RepID=A0A7J7M5N9_9MAGN|nr:hypothetical protein GIB67_023154 [Kingdonia uniflora]
MGLQVASVAIIAIMASIKQGGTSVVARTTVISIAVLCFVTSRWLSHFIYKNFYFHDYNHALI